MAKYTINETPYTYEIIDEQKGDHVTFESNAPNNLMKKFVEEYKSQLTAESPFDMYAFARFIREKGFIFDEMRLTNFFYFEPIY